MLYLTIKIFNTKNYKISKLQFIIRYFRFNCMVYHTHAKFWYYYY